MLNSFMQCSIQSKTPQHLRLEKDLNPCSWSKSAQLLPTGASPNQAKVLVFPFSRLALLNGQLCCALHAVTATSRQDGQAFLPRFGQACCKRQGHAPAASALDLTSFEAEWLLWDLEMRKVGGHTGSKGRVCLGIYGECQSPLLCTKLSMAPEL